MLQKLRRAMVDPDRSLLEYLVEVDESDIPYRTKADPVAGGQGRSQIGKLHIIGAIELSPDGLPRRIRLAPLRRFHRHQHQRLRRWRDNARRNAAQRRFLKLSRPRRLHTSSKGRRLDGGAYRAAVDPSRLRQLQTMGARNLRRRPQTAPGRYLDDFAYRWNRRRHMRSSFGMLIDIATRLPHASYRDFVDQII